jgi:acyl dehydratase
MSLQVGQELSPQTFRVSRADLVRYAGASGDFNPIHWSDRVATEVGLPGVIAHGMYTMALVGQAVTTWAGSPAISAYMYLYHPDIARQYIDGIDPVIERLDLLREELQ